MWLIVHVVVPSFFFGEGSTYASKQVHMSKQECPSMETDEAENDDEDGPRSVARDDQRGRHHSACLEKSQKSGETARVHSWNELLEHYNVLSVSTGSW
eukprot:CAMPEP_0169131348 /NCGR_PEP_ID=MMETSP1015-20121227/38200_1 /TAXON_ID=342587 /ORGANISM="Karlodinium micrum, Strain CCMP2283" /LENGTH=97 /DNA_ID=CAMNT_0009195605 /DNA_START=168 /DNA_END=458 /DNA_ORIENTATION=+